MNKELMAQAALAAFLEDIASEILASLKETVMTHGSTAESEDELEAARETLRFILFKTKFPPEELGTTYKELSDLGVLYRN